MQTLFLSLIIIGAIVIKAQDIVFPDTDYDVYYRHAEAITPSEPFTLSDYQKSNEQFSADLYRELSKEKKGNFLVSPYSLQIILALVHAGARARTSKEIADALHLPDDTNKIQAVISKLSIDSSKGYTLTSVNKAYLEHSFKINNNFKRITQEVFKAGIENINFSKNEEAAAKINHWVESKTNGTIKDLISKDYLNSKTVFVMINALYFNADWFYPFESLATKPSKFFISKTETITVNMMVGTQYHYIYYHEDLDARFLELPYQGHEVSMIIALPNQIDGLTKLENNMDQVLQQQPLISREFESQVALELPKFEVETDIKLENILKNLGIKEAFTYVANFTGMTDQPQDIRISHAVQKTFIRVSEKGTTAGAATSMIGEFMSFGETFIADHPFIYILRHKTNGILFVGKLLNPPEVKSNH